MGTGHNFIKNSRTHTVCGIDADVRYYDASYRFEGSNEDVQVRIDFSKALYANGGAAALASFPEGKCARKTQRPCSAAALHVLYTVVIRRLLLMFCFRLFLFLFFYIPPEVHIYIHNDLC